jgi:hypothetical protein
MREIINITLNVNQNDHCKSELGGVGSKSPRQDGLMVTPETNNKIYDNNSLRGPLAHMQLLNYGSCQCRIRNEIKKSKRCLSGNVGTRFTFVF